MLKSTVKKKVWYRCCWAHAPSGMQQSTWPRYHCSCIVLCRKCNVQWPGNDNLPIDLQTDWAHTSLTHCWWIHSVLHTTHTVTRCLLGLEFASFAFRFRFSRARHIIICTLVCVMVFIFFLLLSFFRACIFCCRLHWSMLWIVINSKPCCGHACALLRFAGVYRD